MNDRWRVMPLLGVVVAGALVCAACGGSSGSSAPAAPPGKPIDLTTKGIVALGAGTDVFGAYAVEANVLGQVLDLPKLNSAGLLVHNPDVQEYRYEEAAGQTVSEYTSQLAANVGLSGSYKFFSAEVKMSFTQDTYRRDDYSYASIIERHWSHSLRVAPAVSGSGAHLRPYLTALARKAIDDTDPVKKWSGADVVAAFGTHVMTGIYAGGRLDYHLAVQILAEEDKSLVSAYAKASYNAVFASATIEGGLEKSEKERLDAYNRVGPVINAKGGEAQYAHPENDEQYKLWKASLGTNPVFCGVIQGELLPIWELATTPARQAEIRASFEAYAATQEGSFAPLVERITDLYLVNAGQGTSVVLPAGYDLIRAASGDTVGGHLNANIWTDTLEGDHVYLAYRAEATEQPVGLGGIHVASSDPATDALFFGAAGHAGLFEPGACTTAGGGDVNLNAGTCGSASVWSYTVWCTYVPPIWGDAYGASCSAPGTPLYLHGEPETAAKPPIRCVVMGDAVAIDSNQPIGTRAAHIFWGPSDANRDTKVDAADAAWVIEHVHWLTDASGTGLVNLNQGVQSYHRWDWWGGCWDAWDDAWIHDRNAAADALYIGVCLP